ncbi:hypothetical protein DFH94DRAFT_292622 [Russula ochroleuca]|uniref:Uncharacterized protein n=1 Tax=Russula ochroleuca TaxID=152965 RepID=A0A9P5JWN9_9AGAM|nr:hypothetical protein DFH94DRAFT_292622 [Russula ochroleuca]
MSLSCGRHRCINGRVDIAASLNLRDAVQRDERECVHSLLTALTCISGQLKDCRHFYICPCPCSLVDFVIFLFNVDQEVFTCVVWWIGLLSMVYGLITVVLLIRHFSPYDAPLSLLARFLYSSVQYVIFTVLYFITSRLDVKRSSDSEIDGRGLPVLWATMTCWKRPSST